MTALTDRERLLEFAEGYTTAASREVDRCGVVGAHIEVARGEVATALIDLINSLPPVDAPDRIPPAIRAGLDRYASAGIRTGSFLQAVLSGDLFDAFKRADPESLLALPAIVAYVRDQLPDASWGSPDLMERWIATARS